MIYTSRNIKDRVAIGDDCFYMEQLGDGRVRLIPAPDQVIEEGTDINKELLQLMEDRIIFLMNRVLSTISTNPFIIRFNSLDELDVESGVWNEEASRLEC